MTMVVNSLANAPGTRAEPKRGIDPATAANAVFDDIFASMFGNVGVSVQNPIADGKVPKQGQESKSVAGLSATLPGKLASTPSTSLASAKGSPKSTLPIRTPVPSKSQSDTSLPSLTLNDNVKTLSETPVGKQIQTASTSTAGQKLPMVPTEPVAQQVPALPKVPMNQKATTVPTEPVSKQVQSVPVSGKSVPARTPSQNGITGQSEVLAIGATKGLHVASSIKSQPPSETPKVQAKVGFVSSNASVSGLLGQPVGNSTGNLAPAIPSASMIQRVAVAIESQPNLLQTSTLATKHDPSSRLGPVTYGKIHVDTTSSMQVAIDGLVMGPNAAIIPNAAVTGANVPAQLDVRDPNALAQFGQLLSVNANEGQTQLHVQIVPQGMGQLDVTITKGENGLQIQVMANQASTFTWLNQSLPSLQQTMQNAGFQVADMQLMFGQQSGQGSDQRQDKQTPTRKGASVQSLVGTTNHSVIAVNPVRESAHKGDISLSI